jgi:hypothetical protein
MSKNNKKRTISKRNGEPTEYTENGREVWDMTAVDRNTKRAARQVLGILESEIVPHWLKEAIETAILDAQKRAGIPSFNVVRRYPHGKEITFSGEWIGIEPKGAEVLSMLFALRPGKTMTLRLSEREQLAQAIATILDSPLTKAGQFDSMTTLYNDVGDFVAEICTPLLDETPEVIERGLALLENGGAQ